MPGSVIDQAVDGVDGSRPRSVSITPSIGVSAADPWRRRTHEQSKNLRQRPGRAEDAELAEELSLRILQPLFRYMHNVYGPVSLVELAEAADLGPEDLSRKECWVSYEQFDRMLRHCRERIGSDQEFMNACAFEMKKLYGPMLLLIRAISIRRAYQILADTAYVVTKGSRYAIEDGPTRTAIRMRYTSDYEESRLACLSRQAQLSAIPTVWWGMRPAIIAESQCVAHGHAACVYDIKWYEPVRWRLPMAGVIAGLLAALAIPSSILMPVAALVVLPIFGLGIGYVTEQRRMIVDHVDFAERERIELEEVLREHARAVDEVLALHQRAQEWSEVQESHVAAHAARLERVVEQLKALGHQRDATLRSISHDMRNPLVVLNLTSKQLLEQHREGAGDTAALARDLREAAQQVRQMVEDLFAAVQDDSVVQRFVPERLEVTALAERLRRQLTAMVMGRDIRVTVFQAREAPTEIVTYRMLLGRLLDNLLSNAAKYTERGSIVIEIAGRPETLSLKVSDTGRGISTEKLARVFDAGEPDPDPLIGSSWGLGMSIVVRLLDQLGGRLEVMSKPNVGTTFWVYLPLAIQAIEPDAGTERDADEPLGDVLARVVKIRRA